MPDAFHIRQQGLFAAGWRPAAGWACVAGLVYSFLVQPLATFASVLAGGPEAPSIPNELLISLLVTMLGLGGLRSLERVQKVIPPGE